MGTLATTRAGILTVRHATAVGLTSAAVRARIAGGRWQRVHYGVPATFSGPLPRAARLWAAVLAGGTDAVPSHDTAIGWLSEPASRPTGWPGTPGAAGLCASSLPGDELL